MEVIESGQDWKIAALRSSFHVHFLLLLKRLIYMNMKYMDLAFDYANEAYKNDEIPVGAVIVKDDSVISFGYNKKEQSNCSLFHAEMIALYDASKILNNWRLDNCDIYVTLDPCPMCASAIKQSRIKNVYSALSNSDSLNNSIVNNIFKSDNTNPEVNFVSNLAVDKSKKLLNDFFVNQRKI